MQKANYRYYTTKEMNFLRANHGRMTAREMSEHLGRSWFSVRSFMFKHKIKNLKVWTKDEENRFIELLSKGYKYSHIAVQLDRTYNSVRAKGRQLKRRDQ